MHDRHFSPRRLFSFIISITLMAGPVFAADAGEAGQRYAASADPVADVRQALERAGAGDRLALVVLGANWCHDSRALASRLSRPPLSDLITEHYELVFVDAGFLDQGRAVVQELGVAHYYATPTVLIVDPANGQVINHADRHQWGNAYTIDMPSSVQYFDRWRDGGEEVDPVLASAELAALNAQIDEFEQQLANRVEAGYGVVGPMLAAYKDGNAPKEIDASWNALRDFRMAIPGDIQALRDDVRRRVTAGQSNIQIDFPTYPLLSWEAE